MNERPAEPAGFNGAPCCCLLAPESAGIFILVQLSRTLITVGIISGKYLLLIKNIGHPIAGKLTRSRRCTLPI